MTEFRTPVPLDPQEPKITKKSKVILLGSCFAENVGSYLEKYKFNSVSNPFGVLFNPISICEVIEAALLNTNLDSDLFCKKEKHYYHFQVHSRLNAPTQDMLSKKIEQQLQFVREYLNNSSHLILTFGSAIIRRHLQKKAIVANCHKQPEDLFQTELLSVDEIVLKLEKLISLLPKDITVILNTSPVRHLKEGFTSNQLSKSTLILASQKVVENHERVKWFPSWEIMMDELRDYRFYGNDMIHPNHTAIEYIWGKFCETWLDNDAKQFLKKWNKIITALGHRPFTPQSTEHIQFLEKTLKTIKDFKDIDVSQEIRTIENAIAEHRGQ